MNYIGLKIGARLLTWTPVFLIAALVVSSMPASPFRIGYADILLTVIAFTLGKFVLAFMRSKRFQTIPRTYSIETVEQPESLAPDRISTGAMARVWQGDPKLIQYMREKRSSEAAQSWKADRMAAKDKRRNS
jgi:hypothetical protein